MNRVPDADGTTRMPSVLPPRFPLPRATTINFWLFWVVALVTVANLPGIERFTDFSSQGTTRFIALGWIAVAFTARASPMGSLGKPGTLFLATTALHMIIGTSVSSYNDAHFVFVWHQKYIFLGMLIVAATATGVVDAASRIGTDRLLLGVLAIMTLTCLSMLLSPFTIFLDVQSIMMDGLMRSGRVRGTAAEANHAAFIACLTVALAGATIIWRGRSALPVLAICVAAGGLLLTLSRTGLVLLFVVIAMLLYLGLRERGVKAVMPSTLLVAGFLAGIGWMISVVSGSAWRGLAVGRLTTLETERFWVLEYGWSLIIESPLIGHGINTFYTMEGLPGSCWTLPGLNCGVHMQFLLFWGEAGVVPFLTFVLFFVTALAACWRPPRSLLTTVAFLWTLCLGLYCLTAHNVLTPLNNYFFVGVICGGLTLHKKAKQAASDLYQDKPLE